MRHIILIDSGVRMNRIKQTKEMIKKFLSENPNRDTRQQKRARLRKVAKLK